MNRYMFIIALFLIGVSACTAGAPAEVTPAGPPAQGTTTSTHTAAALAGIFEGITPCSNTKRPLPQIPADASCRQMIWRLELKPDSTYLLNSAYGMPHQGTTGIIGGGVKVEMQGRWTITRGTLTDPAAAVIHLTSADAQESVSFLVVSDDLLHLLDGEKNLMVGKASWSYTLSRTGGQASESAPGDSAVKYSSFLGTYEGRTPCTDALAAFAKLPKNPSCNRIKWRLFLFQDANTGDPTTYLFNGTSADHEGTWEIVRGSATDPDAIVYQLNPKGSRPLYLLKVDENNLFILDENRAPLVGDRLWSYTLSRTD